MLKKMMLTLGVMLFTNSVFAEIVVVVNPSNNNALDAASVQRIFLGKDKKFSDGSEAISINQVSESQLRQDFDQNILGRSTSQVAAYWSKLVFTGKGIPPKEVASDADVIDLVSKNPSVIGYINKASVTDAVKIIAL